MYLGYHKVLHQPVVDTYNDYIFVLFWYSDGAKGNGTHEDAMTAFARGKFSPENTSS